MEGQARKEPASTGATDFSARCWCLLMAHEEQPSGFCALFLWNWGAHLLASLGHTGRRVVLGHVLNTLWQVITTKSHHVLSKRATLSWAVFTALLGRMRAAGCRLDTPHCGSSSGVRVGRYLLPVLRRRGRKTPLMSLQTCALGSATSSSAIDSLCFPSTRGTQHLKFTCHRSPVTS